MPDQPMEELIAKSVTSGELSLVRNGAVLNIMVPFIQPYTQFPLPPSPPPYWSISRDLLMRSTVHHEAMWAAAVSIAITKAASRGFAVTGSIPKRVRNAQELLLNSDGRKIGWVGFLTKHMRDYLTTDNGSFIEIVRSTKAYGSQIVGIKHLDSIRCTRTGDPKIPVLYRDRVGRVHEMREHQVLYFSDMPDPGETYWGVGLCAASRSYNAIYKLNSIETYLKEKVSGLRPLAIYIVNGVLDKQLRDAITVSQQNEIARGAVSYMGAVVVGVPDEIQPQLVTIPLAELPDRFQRKEEFDISVLTYADNLGLDPQDLQPISSGTLGQSGQSQILHEKAKGKGIISWVQQFSHMINEWVIPDQTTFAFTEKDYQQMQIIAGISKQRADVSASRITAQITTPAQELQVLVDQDELPKEFLTVDTTTTESLSDMEKPDPLRLGLTEAQLQNDAREAAKQPPNTYQKPPTAANAASGPAKAATTKPAPGSGKPVTNITDNEPKENLKELEEPEEGWDEFYKEADDLEKELAGLPSPSKEMEARALKLLSGLVPIK